MDQKVTPDVLAFIADCVVNYSVPATQEFTKNDIWQSSYFSKNVVLIYNKPDADNKTAVHEYDKFTAQPLKTLAYAGVLKEVMRGGTNYYRINDVDILRHISLSDRNAFNFLLIYLTKVLEDSGFIAHIDNYITQYKRGTFSVSDFNDLKIAFERFIIGNTKINGLVEVRRIFPKVINIFAVSSGAPGSRKGRVTDGAYSYSDLMYNAINFRDVGKLKSVTRQERAGIVKSVEEYSEYEMRKAMQAIKERSYPSSEVHDKYATGEATQVHHIFPRSSNKAIRSSLENLILLTPQQHNSLAHPSNRTNYIDPDYQLVCLLSKVESVKTSVMADDGFYSKEGLVNVINHGLGLELSKHASFESISHSLRSLQRNS